MKTLALKFILFFFLVRTYNVQGQVTSLLKSDTLTFFGFDFSKAKMIGPEGFNNPKDIKERKIDSWNRQLTNDIKDLAFSVDARNKKVVFDVRPIKKINTEIDYQDLVVYNPKDLALIHSDSVWEQLKKLETDKYKGLGLIYVVDYFSQKEKLAQAYAVFFDIESKAVLMKNSVYGEPDGFGFSDYWGVALKNIIIKSSQYYGGWVKSAIKKERQKTKQLGAK